MKIKILIFGVIAFLLWVGIMCIGSDGLSELAKKLNPEKPNPDMIRTVAEYNEFKWKFPEFNLDEFKSDRIDFLRILISIDQAFPPPKESILVSLSGPAKMVQEPKSWSNSDLIQGKKYNQLVFNAYNKFIKEYPDSCFAKFAQYRIGYLKRMERSNNSLAIAEIVKKKDMKTNRTCFTNFGNSLTSLFGRSGIKVFVAGTVESGAWINLECNSYALGNEYCPDVPFPKKEDCKFLYTGAKISGKFIYRDADQSIEKAFKGSAAVDTLRVLKSNNMTFEQPESASEAPYENAYPKKEIDRKIVQLIKDLYGVEAVVQAFLFDTLWGGRFAPDIKDAIIEAGADSIKILENFLNQNPEFINNDMVLSLVEEIKKER